MTKRKRTKTNNDQDNTTDNNYRLNTMNPTYNWSEGMCFVCNISHRIANVMLPGVDPGFQVRGRT